jgi:hypothetical protein
MMFVLKFKISLLLMEWSHYCCSWQPCRCMAENFISHAGSGDLSSMFQKFNTGLILFSLS